MLEQKYLASEGIYQRLIIIFIMKRRAIIFSRMVSLYQFLKIFHSLGMIVAPYDIEHSIAQFYGGISYYIFDEEFCEGKTMGLAPFGRPGIYSYDAFELSDNRAFLKHDWMKNFYLYLGGKYQSFSEYFQYYADIAFWAQYQIEKARFIFLILITIYIRMKMWVMQVGLPSMQ